MGSRGYYVRNNAMIHVLDGIHANYSEMIIKLYACIEILHCIL